MKLIGHKNGLHVAVEYTGSGSSMVGFLILNGHVQPLALPFPSRTHARLLRLILPLLVGLRAGSCCRRGFSKSHVFLSIVVLVNLAQWYGPEVLGQHPLGGQELTLLLQRVSAEREEQLLVPFSPRSLWGTTAMNSHSHHAETNFAPLGTRKKN